MINRAASFGIGLAVVLSSFSALASPLSLMPPETPPPMPTELPGLVSRRIQLDLARRVNVPASQLQIIGTTAASWSDNCLELAFLDESCQQKEIQGWIVLVQEAGTSSFWRYRTDRTGGRLRLDLSSQPGHSNFSAELSQKLLHAASEQLLQPVSELSVGAVQAVAWKDSCLDITESDLSCTQVTIPGFRANVRAGSKDWVYHLSADGSQIARNIVASDAEGKVGISFIDDERLIDTPSPTDSSVIFQGQYLSWLENNIRTTTLSSDGTVTFTMTSPDPNIDEPSGNVQVQISPEEVAAFQTLLARHNFSSFDQIGYHTDSAVVFEGTYTVTGLGASVGLSHSDTGELPEGLQQIVEAWEKISF